LVPGNNATFESVSRLLNSGGCKGNEKSKATTNKKDSLVDAIGLSAMAGSTGESVKRASGTSNKLLDKLDEYLDVEYSGDLPEENVGMSEKKQTDNGTPFCFQPSYFQWTMEDESFNTYAVVLMVLESGLGTSEKIVKAKVENDGTVLRVSTYKPPAVTTLRFLEKACLESKMPELWVRHFPPPLPPEQGHHEH
jgi:hypothetical protein